MLFVNEYVFRVILMILANIFFKKIKTNLNEAVD